MSESATWFLTGTLLGSGVTVFFAALVWGGQRKGR